MTLHTVTVTHMTCDGTLATACDAIHPDIPHGCPEALTVPPGAMSVSVLAAARWTVVPGKRLLMEPARHYCPTHRDQAWPEGCRCTFDAGTRVTHDCPHHAPSTT